MNGVRRHILEITPLIFRSAACRALGIMFATLVGRHRLYRS